jgi:hypothetical protein
MIDKRRQMQKQGLDVSEMNERIGTYRTNYPNESIAGTTTAWLTPFSTIRRVRRLNRHRKRNRRII